MKLRSVIWIAAAAWGGVTTPFESLPNRQMGSSLVRGAPRRTPSMSVRYLGSPALAKKTSASLASSRGRRPLISVDSACYIAANYRSRRDYYEHHRQRRLSQLLVARGTQQRRTLRRVASQTTTEEPPFRRSSTPSSASSAEAWRSTAGTRARANTRRRSSSTRA